MWIRTCDNDALLNTKNVSSFKVYTSNNLQGFIVSASTFERDYIIKTADTREEAREFLEELENRLNGYF